MTALYQVSLSKLYCPLGGGGGGLLRPSSCLEWLTNLFLQRWWQPCTRLACLNCTGRLGGGGGGGGLLQPSSYLEWLTNLFLEKWWQPCTRLAFLNCTGPRGGGGRATPTLFQSGMADQLIPPKMMTTLCHVSLSKRYWSSLSVQWWIQGGGGHGGLCPPPPF